MPPTPATAGPPTASTRLSDALASYRDSSPYHVAAPAPVQTGAPATAASALTDQEPPRSALSPAAIETAFIAMPIKAGLDLARSAKKLPESFKARNFLPSPEAGKLETSLHKYVGRLPQNLKQMALVAPDTRIIDPHAPMQAAESARGLSYSTLDRRGYVASNSIGTAIAGVQLIGGGINLREAWTTDGVAGTYDMKSGRSGVLQTVSGALGLGMVGYAMKQESGNIFARFGKSMGSELLTSPKITNIGIAASLIVGANELGFFDFMDKNNKRSFGKVMSDAVHNLPFL
ncbi:MAG: hypothetical protein H7123_03160 [Thermoleophilia bacterium]|nr:hypothetical protein [Thermoleophilia bacterium]